MSARPLIRLYPTLRQVGGLHERHDRTRSTSKTVTVNRRALINVLMDHAQMLDALRKCGRVDVEDGD